MKHRDPQNAISLFNVSTGVISSKSHESARSQQTNLVLILKTDIRSTENKSETE